MNTTIDPARLDRALSLPIRSGPHESLADGACVMELVSYLAGEPWSDHPACACPVITRFLVTWNDALPDDETRARLLRPLLARVVGTRSSREVEMRRAYLALDWCCREMVPAWCELTEALRPHGAALRALPEIADLGTLANARDPLNAAWAAAWDAAWAAARDAARDAAWAAAWDAAWAAAWVVAGDAAGDAAWDAAGAVAGDVAGAAAWDAAGDALAPTVAALQASALRLVERMCEVQT